MGVPTETPMSCGDLYANTFQVCRGWAETGGKVSLDEIASRLPATTAGSVTLDPSMLGVVVATNTDLANAAKLQGFRVAVNQLFTESGSACFSGEAEPWYEKDVLQLLCEVVLLRDLSTMQQETLAIVIQSVVDFGRDAMATIAFLLVMRVVWGLGRAATAAEETQWVVQACLKGIERANEYLVSEHAGSLRLQDLLQNL